MAKHALVDLTVYEEGGVVCNDEKCKFVKTCANHRTAGDYRNEDGFSPDIRQSGNDYVCLSKGSPASKTIYGQEPSNVVELDRGEVNLEDVRRASQPDNPSFRARLVEDVLELWNLKPHLRFGVLLRQVGTQEDDTNERWLFLVQAALEKARKEDV